MQRVFCAPVIATLSLFLLAGCGGGNDADLPEVVPVSGTVILDGQPAAGVNVTFIPVGATPGGSCYGTTDSSGKYELKTNDGRTGACVGEFKVVCGKWVLPDGSEYVGEAGGPSPLEAGAKERLPAKYSQEGQTTLKATVPAGGGSVGFELKSK